MCSYICGHCAASAGYRDDSQCCVLLQGWTVWGVLTHWCYVADSCQNQGLMYITLLPLPLEGPYIYQPGWLVYIPVGNFLKDLLQGMEVCNPDSCLYRTMCSKAGDISNFIQAFQRDRSFRVVVGDNIDISYQPYCTIVFAHRGCIDTKRYTSLILHTLRCRI